MSQRRMFLILLTILSVGLLTVLWPKLPSVKQALNQKHSPISFSKSNLGTGLSKEQESVAEAYRKPPTLAVSAEVLHEAHLAGMMDQDPTVSEKRLNKIAENLTADEIASMAELVKSPSNDGDLRALAVDLLARNKGPRALEPLEQIIISKWPDLSDPRMIGFEQSLRGRAIEGLEGHPAQEATGNLQRALSQVQDSFLNDHGQRALLHRQGQARSVEEQDEEALRKILKNSNYL